MIEAIAVGVDDQRAAADVDAETLDRAMYLALTVGALVPAMVRSSLPERAAVGSSSSGFG